MLCPDPSKRPSAEEIVSRLPQRSETEEAYLREAIDSVTDPNSVLYNEMLAALFSRSTPAHTDYTYDALDPRALARHADHRVTLCEMVLL